jgi:L-2,4-diaminobutyric acid acetyltransferase
VPVERISDAGSADIARLAAPRLEDGKSLWRLAGVCGLDVNSPYAYVLWCRDFAETSVVAKDTAEQVRGFVTGYIRPAHPDTYFLWQVAVDPELRGRRLARRMLDHIAAANAAKGLRYLEATVTPDNAASRALFTSFAQAQGAELHWTGLFERAHFPHDGDAGGHEREELVRIGPFD